MHDGVNSHGMARFEMNFDHMFSKHVAFDGVRRRAGLFLKYLMVHRLDLFQTSSVLDSFHRWYIFATGVLLSKPMEPSQWLLWCRTHPHVSVEWSFRLGLEMNDLLIAAFAVQRFSPVHSLGNPMDR